MRDGEAHGNVVWMTCVFRDGGVVGDAEGLVSKGAAPSPSRSLLPIPGVRSIFLPLSLPRERDRDGDRDTDMDRDRDMDIDIDRDRHGPPPPPPSPSLPTQVLRPDGGLPLAVRCGGVGSCGLPQDTNPLRLATLRKGRAALCP